MQRASVGTTVNAASLLLGVAIGLVGGYYRHTGAIAMRVMDGLMAIPAILLALALMAPRHHRMLSSPPTPPRHSRGAFCGPAGPLAPQPAGRLCARRGGRASTRMSDLMPRSRSTR